MCGTCGCAGESGWSVRRLDPDGAEADHRRESHRHMHADGTRHDHAHEGDHAHGPAAALHGHGHEHTHPHGAPGETVALGERILAKNDALAARNRAWFAGREILALNLVSAPGAGKTTLLERTIADLRAEFPLSVLEGDQATDEDSARIRAAGAPAVQINTGTGCHLEAEMVARGLAELKPALGSVVMIENVGNLVCPALFDLGERARVLLFSVVEGETKPLKYPHIFRAADLVLLGKADLLAHVDFDPGKAIENVRRVNPQAAVLRVSARSGEGLGAWYGWIREQAGLARAAALDAP